MIIREVKEEERSVFNQAATHPLQSWEWGEFRKSMGSELLRLGIYDEGKLVKGFQMYSTIFPKTDKTVWLLLRGPMPDAPMLEAVRKYASEKNGIFVKIEPEVRAVVENGTEVGHQAVSDFLLNNGCVLGKPFFATHTFWIDLTLSADQLFSKMKEKTRYNVRLANKRGVVVGSESSPEAFETHLDLMFGTADRQGFKAHTRDYHRKMWATLKDNSNGLKAYLLQAKYENKTIASWVLFVFGGTLYYPYGASSNEHREVMGSHAMMWAAIEFGKKLGCKRFDLWGSAAPNYKFTDPWAGFTKFKEGFGGDWISYVGSFDLILNPLWYRIYKVAEKVRGVVSRFGVTI